MDNQKFTALVIRQCRSSVMTEVENEFRFSKDETLIGHLNLDETLTKSSSKHTEYTEWAWQRRQVIGSAASFEDVDTRTPHWLCENCYVCCTTNPKRCRNFQTRDVYFEAHNT